MSVAVKLDKRYSYADYLNWPEDERWEIIEGVPYDMSPAPNTEHQSISMKLSIEIGNFLKGKRYQIFAAPFDVRFAKKDEISDNETYTVVQPDLLVVCDKKKLDKKGCVGAPDIAVEILSPATAYKDETEKLKLYEKQGVREYWIVNPKAQYMMIYRLNEDRFDKPDYYHKEDVVNSKVLEGFSLKLPDIW